MNAIAYCREVAKGLIPEDAPDYEHDSSVIRRVMEAELILLANSSLHSLMQLKIKAEEVADYIKRTVEEHFPDLGVCFYTSYVHALLSNSNLHMLVAGIDRVYKVSKTL